MRIRLLISYDGTDYAGWQRQSLRSPDPRPTLQATLEEALGKIFNHEIKVQASGRTDAGVHADEQTVHFDVPVKPNGLPTKDPQEMKIVRSLNGLTPPTLAVKKAWLAPGDFHALHSAEKKTYRYMIHNSPVPNPMRARYSQWITKPLDLNKLNGLAECLIGQHDFKSFQTSGTEVKSTVRQITEAHWRLVAPDLVEFRITGTGFLKQMVRNIVGTLLYLHQNSDDPLSMKKILESRDRQAAKTTAPPEGLFLEKVYYPAGLDNECREL